MLNNNTYFCVIHFDDYPYVAFEAAGIKYPEDCRDHHHHSSSAESSIACFYSLDPIMLQNRSFIQRKPDFDELRKSLDEKIPVNAKIILGGDFNEPSCHDWTEEAVSEGFAPISSIVFPTTAVIEHLGFIDSYRYLHPDPVRDRGITWPDRDPGFSYRSDRIDFIFLTKNIIPVSSEVISTRVSDHSIVKTCVIL